jgi:hypothetical protein
MSEKYDRKDFKVATDKKEEKEIKQKEKMTIKKLYEIILVSDNYIVIKNSGNNQLVLGKYTGIKIGEMIELDL